MRLATTGGLAALCMLTLAGCTGSMSHQAAWQTVLGGVVGGVAFFGLAKLFRGPDGGGSLVVAVASGITGIIMLFWATEGAVSLMSPEPAPGSGVYQCVVTADHHVLVGIRNVGSLPLLVGSVTIQPQDAAGKPQGSAMTLFLKTALKLPHHIEGGTTQTFDLGDVATGGRPEPARCAVMGASRTSGNAPGSMLSGY